MELHTYNNYVEERTASEPTIIDVNVSIEDVVKHTREIRNVPIHIPNKNLRICNGIKYNRETKQVI